jgi:hypothetical protein
VLPKVAVVLDPITLALFVTSRIADGWLGWTAAARFGTALGFKPVLEVGNSETGLKTRLPRSGARSSPSPPNRGSVRAKRCCSNPEGTALSLA